MFDWLFRKSNFHRFQDSFAFNPDAVMKAIVEAVTARLDLDGTVLLLVHFPDSLVSLQKQLDELDIPYEIEASHLDDERVANLSKEKPNRVYLSMAGMLRGTDQKQLRVAEPSVAVMVAERHPMPKYDQQITQWCKWLPFPTQLGYFLSLEDPVVNLVITDQVKKLLSHFGMGENELITSNLVSRRLNRVLSRSAAKVTNEVAADNPISWIELNYAGFLTS